MAQAQKLVLGLSWVGESVQGGVEVGLRVLGWGLGEMGCLLCIDMLDVFHGLQFVLPI